MSIFGNNLSTFFIDEPKQMNLEVHYRLVLGSRYRVWRNDWRGDIFNVLIRPEQLIQIQAACDLLSIPCIEHH